MLAATICSGETKTDEPWAIYGVDTPMTRLMGNHYKIPEITVVSVGQEMHYTDDVSVCLYLASAAGVDPYKITKWRKEAKSWMEIMDKIKFHPARLFTNAGTYTVPEAYRHAYGEYLKFNSNKNYKMTLYDKEVRNLVQLKFLVTRFKKSPLSVMNRRNAGEDFTKMILENIQ